MTEQGELSVALRITPAGSYYRHKQEEFGPYSLEQEQDPKFQSELAKTIGVEPKEILAAQLHDLTRPTSWEEVGEVLGSTVRRDISTKLIIFAAGLLNTTDEDQINLLMSSESAAGKSYGPVQILAYFPSDALRIIGGASPTAFFHEHGEWDEVNHVVRVDLRKKILIFLDQPHYALLERLRPLASHDQREIRYMITDKSKGGAHRTKNVIIVGFPTIVFCSARLSSDEQEKTRCFLLSPETSQEKLEESILLAIVKGSNRQAFGEWLETHPQRRWLRVRVHDLYQSGIEHVIVPDPHKIYDQFRQLHRRFAPRQQRDVIRILGLIKAHALLNHRQREKEGEHTILATMEDVDAGFELYNLIAESNELGLAPQVYEIYRQVVKPLLAEHESVNRTTLLAKYRDVYGRILQLDKLRREILPALESSGLIVQEPDPTDKRKTLVLSPDAAPISEGSGGNGGEMWGYSQPKSEQVPVNGPAPKPVDGSQAIVLQALSKLRTVQGPMSKDYAIEQIQAVTGDLSRAEACFRQLEKDGHVFSPKPDEWRLTR